MDQLSVAQVFSLINKSLVLIAEEECERKCYELMRNASCYSPTLLFECDIEGLNYKVGP